MAATSLDDFICVPLPSDLHKALADRFPDSVSTVLENITWDFLERTEGDFLAPSADGIYWGSFFMPNGTLLRIKKSRSLDYEQAEIINEKIIWKEKEIASSSQFARKAKGNTSVNAWITIEVKRPQDRVWKLANEFR